MSEPLTDGEKQTLLRLARTSIEHAVKGKKIPPLDASSLTPALKENGASFVTLTIHGGLRGCIGALEAYQPLAEDVCEHAVAAALQDPRFPPVSEGELDSINIEVSRLTAPRELEYSSSADLLKKLRPQVDGVILKYGGRRATFLPQVWQQLPQPAEFLRALKRKAGLAADFWAADLRLSRYEVRKYRETIDA